MEGKNRKLNRWKGYDYSLPGYYFITICAQDKCRDRTLFCPFGKIIGGKMILNEHGKIVNACWMDLPNHYYNCVLNAFVVMPNHAHGIMVIKSPCRERFSTVPPRNAVQTNYNVTKHMCDASKLEQFSTSESKQFPTSESKQFPTSESKQFPTSESKQFPTSESKQFPTSESKQFPTSELERSQTVPYGDGNKKPHGLSEIIRGFKTFSSKRINALQNEFMFHWQKSFHDHIIRNDVELYNIQQYIVNNPMNWETDRNNHKTLT